MQEEAGGGALSTPLIGGGLPSLCVSGESGEQGVYHTPQKNAVAQVGRQVWRDPCRGIPFRYAKIIKKSSTMHKIGRKMMFLGMSDMICQNFCLNLHRFIRAV